MAQKRNPVSLRLQTRLEGYEKRFASCWFTDSFFSQMCTNDLFLRLYYGHLLQKGGSWYGEVSELRVPESCISLQFLYRRCSILSVILDKRKEEYAISSTGTRARREGLSVSLQSENKFLEITTKKEAEGYNHSLWNLSKQDNILKMRGERAPFLVYPKALEFSNKTIYSSMANIFTYISTQHKRCFPIFLGKERQISPSFLVKRQLHLEAGKLEKMLSCYNVNQGCAALSLIESVCNVSQEYQGENKNLTYHKLSPNAECSYGNQVLVENRNNHLSKYASQRSVAANNPSDKDRITISFLPFGHWTSTNLIRGVSAYQNVEFCLHSVALLYSQRFSFLKIKDTLFRKLASNPSVLGARLVCSGRQGGRSKSAMRAKKQSAILGRTALSLFSSRLAFASTNVDTTFGQIGIKLWICYK